MSTNKDKLKVYNYKVNQYTSKLAKFGIQTGGEGSPKNIKEFASAFTRQKEVTKESLEKLTAERDKYFNLLKNRTDRIKTLNTEITSLEGQLRTRLTKEQQTQLEDELAEKKRELATAESQLATAKSDLSAAQNALQDETSAKQALAEKVDNAENNLTVLYSKLDIPDERRVMSDKKIDDKFDIFSSLADVLGQNIVDTTTKPFSDRIDVYIDDSDLISEFNIEKDRLLELVKQETNNDNVKAYLNELISAYKLVLGKINNESRKTELKTAFMTELNNPVNLLSDRLTDKTELLTSIQSMTSELAPANQGGGSLTAYRLSNELRNMLS
uniref:Uncharacterized protein n=1 Tax=viral metagenome TaxID=1070528 RepID=A0A6C0ED70_9ZZZZ